MLHDSRWMGQLWEVGLDTTNKKKKKNLIQQGRFGDCILGLGKCYE